MVDEECTGGHFGFDREIDVGYPWLCGSGQIAADGKVIDGEEHFVTALDPPPPPQCPVPPPQSASGVHPADLIDVATDWQFHLEK
jgi:hypothetical protein